MTKFGQMVLKEVSWLHNDKIRSNGLERSNYTIKKSSYMVLKGVHLVQNTKIRSNGLEMS